MMIALGRGRSKLIAKDKAAWEPGRVNGLGRKARKHEEDGLRNCRLDAAIQPGSLWAEISY